MKLKLNDYVCIRRKIGKRRYLEFGIYQITAIPVIAFMREHFENYWPGRFPRSPLYLIKVVNHEPVIIRQIGYAGCPIKKAKA